uniref:Uncharacterized protein n=1 Tax=Triticum urartu TaxID=4572 RepID=A0A8R7PSM4_TRIUA
MSAISQAIRACAVESGASTTSLVSMDAMRAGGAWAKGPPAAERGAGRGGKGGRGGRGARAVGVHQLPRGGQGHLCQLPFAAPRHGPHHHWRSHPKGPLQARRHHLPRLPRAAGQPPTVERRHRLPSSHRDPLGSKNPSTQSSPRFPN